MDEGKGKAIEMEPSFDIDDLMELLPDDDPVGPTDIGMEKEGMLGPSSNINNLNQENKPMKLEDFQIIGTGSSSNMNNLNQEIKPVKLENYQVDGSSSNINNLNREKPMKLEDFQVIGSSSNINNLNQEHKPMKLENYHVVGSSSNINNLNQENKPVKLENYQVVGTQSDIMPPISRNWKPVDSPTDNSTNSIAHSLQRSTLPNMYTEFSQSPTSCNIVSQSHQHQPQQLQHQFHNQTAMRPNIQPMSAKFNVYHNIQRQQQPVQQKQNTAFVMHQQQQKIGYHIDSPPMKHHEQFNLLKHTGQMTPEKNLQQISKTMQMRQILETSCDPGTNCVQRKLMTSAFPRSHNHMLVDQQKQQVERSHNALRGILQGLEPVYHLMLTNSTDWVDQVFKQIELMNDASCAELITLYKRALELMEQATTEQEKRSERNKCNFYRKIVQLLKIPKNELAQCPKENIFQYISDIVVNLKKIFSRNIAPSQHHQQLKASGNTSRTPSLQQQKGNVFQFTQVNPFHNNTPTSVPQLMMQHGNMNLQGNSMNQFQIGSSTGMQKSDPSSLMNSIQYNLMKSRQQFSPGQSQQGMTLPQRSSVLSIPMGTSSPANSFNSLDFAVRSLSPNPVLTASQHNRRPDQHLAMQKKMKQPVQMLTERNKQQMVQKMNEEAKLAQFVGYNQRMPVKHPSQGPHLEPYPWPLLQASSTPYRGTSPQSSQQSSTQLELKELSAKLSRSATPLLSIASPSAVPSPPTPVTPCSIPTEQEKIPSCLNQVSVEERNKATKTPIEPSLLQSRIVSENQVPVTQEIIAKTPLITESTCPVDCQLSRAKTNPAQRLIEVVKSMSQKALHASVRDINTVTCVVDTKPENYLQGSKWMVTQDFDLVRMKTRMKRQFGSIYVDDMTSAFCKSDQTSEVESDAKRLKTEPDILLLEEIKEINHKLIETVVDVVDVKDVSGAGSAAGTVVRCLYNAAVQCDGNVKITATQMFSNLMVELLVTADYPNSSPVVLDRLPPGYSEDEDVKVLWTKAKSNFSLSLRKFSQPISLKEMAKTWDVCAREVFREFVQKFGGGDFSSKYGKWENCVIAT